MRLWAVLALISAVSVVAFRPVAAAEHNVRKRVPPPRPTRHVTKSSPSRLEAARAPSAMPETLETAQMQLRRLFDRNVGSLNMSRTERFVRIVVGWSLLLTAKSIALASPLFFRSLVNKGKVVYGLIAAHGPMALDTLLQASAMGLILGYGSAKLAAGFVQLVCELILSSATVSAAEALPQEAFAAALASASRRWDDGVVGAAGGGSGASDKGLASGAAAAAGGQDEGRSGFARRALDRGLRASNQFLYRTIFNLLPSFVESFCVVCLMIQRAGYVVGLTAGLVAYTFVGLTMFVMHKRMPILRRMLRDEGVANGCAEDALSLAETVASFGAMRLEERRYADALAGVSRSGMRVRYSYSFLKLAQSIVLAAGAAALIFVTWKTATHPTYMAANGALTTLDSRFSVAGQLVLVQALFAQLVAPLDHVGQHFRDAVSAAEDLRELEVLKRVLAGAGAGAAASEGRRAAAAEADSAALPRVSRQLGGRRAWAASPPRLEVRDLVFSYPQGEDGPAVPILRNVSFSVPAGGYSLGIVGPSGSGKSTVLRVLLGLEPIEPSDSPAAADAPSSGSIRIDGADVSGRNRIPCFSMVGQDNDLFRGLSLADNVRYGTHTVLGAGTADSPEAVAALRNAAEDAQLAPLLARVQGGWDASVGPRGRLLSGGERQRVCLARALYREELAGGILLMDEVTASLDAKTESLVTDAVIGRVSQGATAVLIAHRLSSVQHCDMILVMKDGVVAERGTHAQLVSKGGWYAESWRLQSQTQGANK